MLIEITGTSTRNKGAELMLLAIKQQLQKMDPTIKLAADFSFGSYADRARYGLLQKIEISRFGRSRLSLELMPATFRRAMGIVREHEVDVVLDASGFAFGDQHPVERSTRFAAQAEDYAQAGKPLVLLPQAFGPFQSVPHREAFRRIVAAASRVYARDKVSYEHALKATGEESKIFMAPDITGLVRPDLEGISAVSRRVCIVPNSRMIEFASSKEEERAYLRMISDCIQLTRQRKLEPVILIHGSEDVSIVRKINRQVTSDCEIRIIPDPLALKQFIGESHLLIGSRFHALVNALSQGVPALATSWSHKYEALFEDYGINDGVMFPLCSRDELAKRIKKVSGEHRENIANSIRQCSLEINEQTRKMWCDVASLIGVFRENVKQSSSPGDS